MADEDDPVRAGDAAAPGVLQLSMIIPAFNEEGRLDAGLARLHEAVEAGAIDPQRTEFIVVDDGSTDDSVHRALTLLSRYPHARALRFEHNRGKGAAVRAGMAVASAPTIAFADADMAIDPSQTPRFMDALRSADLAIGSRAARGASVDRTSISRSVMNRLFNRLVNLLTRVSLDDTQCGFKAFRSPAAKLLFHCTVTERMAFDVEILSLARRLGLTITQVPVRWSRVRGSRVRSWSDSRSMVRDVLRARRSGRAAPPVPAFVLEAPPDDAVHVLARLLPVLRLDDERTLVLCPLMEDEDVAKLLAETTQVVSGPAPRLLSVTAAELLARAPLTLSRDATARHLAAG